MADPYQYKIKRHGAGPRIIYFEGSHFAEEVRQLTEEETLELLDHPKARFFDDGSNEILIELTRASVKDQWSNMEGFIMPDDEAHPSFHSKDGGAYFNVFLYEDAEKNPVLTIVCHH